jgi:hypothetical protein
MAAVDALAGRGVVGGDGIGAIGSGRLRRIGLLPIATAGDQADEEQDDQPRE